MKRSVLIIIGLLGIAVIACGAREWRLKPDGKMHVAFLDVGQGDSALITFRNGARMLIDGGPDWSTLESLGKELPFFDRRIDVVLLSHPNSDHMMSLPEVLRRYHVTTLITAGTAFDSGLYRATLSGASRRSIAHTTVRAGDAITMDTATLNILWPPVPRINGMDRDTNNDSIVLRLEENGKRILFTGDAESIVEKTLLAAGVDLKADVLKVSHHGSKTSSSTGFLLAVSPEIAVISVGKNNSYRHPAPAVMKRLEALKIAVRRTDLEGDVEVVW